MKSLQALERFSISNGLMTLLTRVAEGEGREVSLGNAEPELLNQLHHSSVVTSAVASCAIEGIHVAEDRLETLISQKLPGGKRDEQEVLNYKNALDFLYSKSPDELSITPEFIRTLHHLTLEGSAHAGQYKQKDNQIIEIVRGVSRVRFRPVSAHETAAAIEALCLGYQHVLNKEIVPPQIASAALTLDFTCIHPFADGNGRVSRLLAVTAVLGQGRQMPKLISLEELINERKDAYYLALERSSAGWHSANDLTPFVRYHLEILATGYDALKQRILRVKEPFVVVFDKNLSPTHQQFAFNLFTRVYPNAGYKTALLSPIRKVTIEEYSPSLDAETFQKFSHALKFAEKCLTEAEIKFYRSRGVKM